MLQTYQIVVSFVCGQTAYPLSKLSSDAHFHYSESLLMDQAVLELETGLTRKGNATTNIDFGKLQRGRVPRAPFGRGGKTTLEASSSPI